MVENKFNNYERTLAVIRFYKKLKREGKIKPNGMANLRLKQLMNKRKEDFDE
tara:strand:- start:566 stop:721 length:156 start_codon:yes stop_codon:yes gene_type:complete